MIGTRALLYRSAPRLGAFASKSSLILARSRGFSSIAIDKLKLANKNYDFYSPRFFSTAIRVTVPDGMPTELEIQQKSVGTVTKRLRVLDMDVVKKIQDELHSVDVNSDGR